MAHRIFGVAPHRAASLSADLFRRQHVVVLRIKAVPLKTRYGFIGLSLLALTFIIVIGLNDPGRIQRHRNFSDQEIEAAKLKILPLEQAGLIQKWRDEGRGVFVARNAWENQSGRAKRATCQAMSTARSEERLVVLDAAGEVIGVCTASGQFTVIESGVIPDWADSGSPVGPHSSTDE
jgi:hypothetical protein